MPTVFVAVAACRHTAHPVIEASGDLHSLVGHARTNVPQPKQLDRSTASPGLRIDQLASLSVGGTVIDGGACTSRRRGLIPRAVAHGTPCPGSAHPSWLGGLQTQGPPGFPATTHPRRPEPTVAVSDHAGFYPRCLGSGDERSLPGRALVLRTEPRQAESRPCGLPSLSQALRTALRSTRTATVAQ